MACLLSLSALPAAHTPGLAFFIGQPLGRTLLPSLGRTLLPSLGRTLLPPSSHGLQHSVDPEPRRHEDRWGQQRHARVWCCRWSGRWAATVAMPRPSKHGQPCLTSTRPACPVTLINHPLSVHPSVVDNPCCRHVLVLRRAPHNRSQLAHPCILSGAVPAPRQPHQRIRPADCRWAAPRQRLSQPGGRCNFEQREWQRRALFQDGPYGRGASTAGRRLRAASAPAAWVPHPGLHQWMLWLPLSLAAELAGMGAARYLLCQGLLWVLDTLAEEEHELLCRNAELIRGSQQHARG